MERGSKSELSVWGSPCTPSRSPHLRAGYLRTDTEVVVRDEFGALMVASMEPGVEGAEGHAWKGKNEGQEAPSAGCNGERLI